MSIRGFRGLQLAVSRRVTRRAETFTERGTGGEVRGERDASPPRRPALRARCVHSMRGPQMSAIAEPRELSQEDFIALLEERVQASLGMSLEEFVAALREGELDPESPQVAGLALLVGA
jgi:hypothetical protein